jgi:hypothetical protein
MTPDDCREDLRVMITAAGSTFGVVCFGRVSERGDPRSIARDSLSRLAASASSAAIEPETVAGEAGVRYRIPFNTACLIEWKFAHAGWLYGAGALVRKSDNERKAERRARDVLSTWQWLE